MPGFLGTRGDFLSDLLILALALVVPALVVAVELGRRGRARAHRIMMLTLLAVLVTYVVVYEANLLALGGTAYLARVTTMPRVPYFATVAVHVVIGCGALLVGALALRRGQGLLKQGQARPRHTRLGWLGVALLGLSSVTGVVLYWATFVV